jgi:hypothetical protein
MFGEISPKLPGVTNLNKTNNLFELTAPNLILPTTQLSGTITNTQLGTSVKATSFATGVAAVPAFLAYGSVATTCTAGPAYTQIALGTKIFDVGNYFNTTTSNYTPLVAGIYLVNGQISTTGTNAVAGIQTYPVFIQNGATVFPGPVCSIITGTSVTGAVSTFMKFNGTTDFVNMYLLNGNTTGVYTTNTTAVYTYMSAAWIGPLT